MFIRNKRKKRFQSTLEYATLITVVVGALLWMKSWMQKSLQGKYMGVGKQLGDRFDQSSEGDSTLKVTTVTRESPDTVNMSTSSSSSSKLHTEGEKYDSSQ